MFGTHATIFFSLFIVILIILVGALIVIYRKRSVQGHPALAEEDEMGGEAVNKQVYVGNLSYRTGEHDLRAYFDQFGAVVQARIVKNSKTGRSKGFGFVSYDKFEEAKKALSAHGKEMNGRILVVRIAKPR